MAQPTEPQHIGVFCSGGDSPGMNACVRAVVRTAYNYGTEVTGFLGGYQGIVEGKYRSLSSSDVSNIIQLGGTILGSGRSKDFQTEAGRARAADVLKELAISHLVCIGGDGSYAGARQFMLEYPYLHILGCPGTIDNDLAGTDFTIGYDTAINTAIGAIDKIRDTANSHGRLFVVEVMGRDAGLIALRAGIASGAEGVLIPESTTDLEALLNLLERGWKREKRSIIILVAEGDESGGAFAVSKLLQERFPDYDTKVSILGHIQRGGSPTCMDRVLASRLGSEAVEGLIMGKSGLALGIWHKDIVYIPFAEAIKHNREINPYLLGLVEKLSG